VFCLAALLPAAARADTVRVEIVDETTVRALGARGALGLLVAGRGSRTSRAEALDLLDLDPLPACRGRRCTVIALTLPPTAEGANDRPYRIAVVGRGFRGVLGSDRTRIPGLVGITDVRPAVEALERGERPALTARRADDPDRVLARLDDRLDDARATRGHAAWLLVLSTLGLFLAGLTLRSQLLARAALLAVPLGLAASLVASLAGTSAPAPTLGAIAAGIALSTAAAAVIRGRIALAATFVGLLAGYLVLLAVSTRVNTLSAFGPHAETGGRFYGISNRVETLLLPSTLLAGALLGRRALIPVGALALVTVGWSHAGADGGGLVVYAAALLALGIRLGGRRLTLCSAAVTAAAAAAATLVLVLLDSLAGGSSHVTRAVRRGPSELVEDFGRRMGESWDNVTATWHAVLFLLIGLTVLLALARARPRSPVRDALIVGLAVSLLVNDTPVDVLGYGSLGLGVVWGWERLRPAAAMYLH
jgi:hypothetical protein